MGGFAALLGHAAQGYNEAHQIDLQRQFENEQHMRQQAMEHFGKLAADESALPGARQAATQAVLAIPGIPMGKFNQKEFGKLAAGIIQPSVQPPTPEQTTPGQEVGGGQSTLSVPAPPPSMAAPGPSPDMTATVPNRPMQTLPQTVQGPTPPPTGGVYKTPEMMAQEHAMAIGAATGAQTKAQIGARRDAISGLDLPDEQAAALSLGTPGYFGAMNKNAVSGTDTAANLRANGVPVPDSIADGQYVKASQTTGGGWHFAPTVAPPSMVGSEHHGWKQVTQADGSIVLVPVTESTTKVQPGGKKAAVSVGAGSTPAPALRPPAAPPASGIPALTLPAGSKTVGNNPARADQSYKLNIGELDRVGKPVEDSVARFSRLRDTLAQNTPQADALVAPELLTVMAGGQGSGLRMNEAEISRIIGGRSKWEGLQAAVNKWKLDPEAALSITAPQRDQIHRLMDAVNAKLSAKQDLLNGARDRLVAATSPEEHRKIVANARRAISNIDNGQINMRSPDGHTKTVPIEEVEHYKSLGAVVTD